MIIALMMMQSLVSLAQLGGQEYKFRGLEFLDEGQSDSAMVYLNQAVIKGLADGEVLGGLALAYFQKGDAARALENAVEARKDLIHPSADAYLAGVLAYEELGNVRLRDKWMEEGIEAFPSDCLLLYHAGRIAIPFDSGKGERYLLRSIHACPGFGDAHLLLGENMYRRGENLKAVLPLIYYLFLHQDALNSADVAASVERLYDSWAVSTLGISKVSTAGKGFSVDFVPEAFSGSYEERGPWFVKQTVGLIGSMQMAGVSSSDGLWVFYSDFFSQVARLGFDEAMAYHIAYTRYPADAMEWINDNAESYRMLGDWLMLQ
jgi:tetratricopeptide (TPR) repeat protein